MKVIVGIFNDFKMCSGLRINYTKSEILHLGSLPNPKWSLKAPFTVAKSHITYLGIKIGKTPFSIFTINYPLFQKITRELENWMDLPL